MDMMPNRKLKQLDSVDAVFKALGGTHGVSEITGVPYRVALNWSNLYEKLPAKTYVLIQRELSKHGYVGDDQLWGMVDGG
jgi:hypothetical protein